MNTKKQKAGQMGGTVTALRYGPKYMQTIARRGGRPRLPTLDELRSHTAPSVINYIKGDWITKNLLATQNLRELRELWNGIAVGKDWWRGSRSRATEKY